MTAPREPVEALEQLDELEAFLSGERAYEGVWFGSRNPDAKGAYWWRSAILRPVCEIVRRALTKSEVDPESERLARLADEQERLAEDQRQSDMDFRDWESASLRLEEIADWREIARRLRRKT